MVSREILYENLFRQDYTDLREESLKLYHLLDLEQNHWISKKKTLILPFLLPNDYFVIVKISSAENNLIEVYNFFQQQFPHLNNVLFFLVRNAIQVYYERALSLDVFQAHERAFSFKYKSMTNTQASPSPLFYLGLLRSLHLQQTWVLDQELTKMRANEFALGLFRLQKLGEEMIAQCLN